MGVEMRGAFFCLVVSALALGCGDDDSTTPGTDAGPVPETDAGEMMMMGEVPALVTGDGADPTDPTGEAPRDPAPPELSCFGTGVEPTGGDDVTFQLEIKEFRTDDTLEDLCVKFYADNMPMPGDTCDPDSDLTTDADGRVEVTAPAGGWYAYRVFPKDGPTPALQVTGSVQINEPAPMDEGATIEGNSVSQATLNLIPTVLGFRPDPGTALVAGTFWDCEEDPLYGGVARVYTEDGTEIMEGTGSSDPHYRYFDGDDFPADGRTYTHTDGIFTVANVPVAADGEFVFVEVWGRREAVGEMEIISCERLPIFADTIAIVNMAPLRETPPACPGLSD